MEHPTCQGITVRQGEEEERSRNVSNKRGVYWITATNGEGQDIQKSVQLIRMLKAFDSHLGSAARSTVLDVPNTGGKQLDISWSNLRPVNVKTRGHQFP
jgi:hypothetical protein